MKIEGRTFVISGGASGLGRATALDLAQHGGYVAILDMNDEAGAELAAALGPQGRFFACDVLETESIASAVDGAAQWAEATGKPLGGVIPAAGVSTPATILDRENNPFSMDDFDFVMNVNVRGTIDLVRQTLPHLIRSPAVSPSYPSSSSASSSPSSSSPSSSSSSSTSSADAERGVLILVSSSAAFDGQKGQVSYAASKGAIRALTLPLARDLSRHNIRVVTIAPSLFESNMTAVMSGKVRASLERVMEFPRRSGRGEEFAHLVRACVENVMLNGEVVRLDGAMRMPSKM